MVRGNERGVDGGGGACGRTRWLFCRGCRGGMSGEGGFVGGWLCTHKG